MDVMETPYQCLTEATNKLTLPPIKNIKKVTITTEDNIKGHSIPTNTKMIF